MLPGSDPVRSEDGGIPPASPATTRMCIISRDPLRAFIGALNPALRGCEELTIVVDRRQAALGSVAGRPALERRHHPSVDAKVETDGFAIVSLSTTEGPPDPPWIERVVDHQAVADYAEADEREVQRILQFKRRKMWIGRLARVCAIVGAVTVPVVLCAQMPAGKALVNRARLVAVREETSEPAIEPHALSVVEAPAPSKPSRAPVERIGARDTGRTSTEVVSPPPRPESSASRQSKRPPTNPTPTPPARPESVGVPEDTAPTPRLSVTPPGPVRPLTVASSASTSPPAPAPEPARPTQTNSPPGALPDRPSTNALDATRSSESSPPPIAHTVSSAGELTQSPSIPPRQRRGLEAWIHALQSHVKGDVDTAGAEAKRQIAELNSKTMRNLDEIRRVWNNATHVFSDKDANQHAEAAAKPR